MNCSYLTYSTKVSFYLFVSCLDLCHGVYLHFEFKYVYIIIIIIIIIIVKTLFSKGNS